MEVYKYSAFVRCRDANSIDAINFEVQQEYGFQSASYDLALDSKTIAASLKILAALEDEGVERDYKRNCEIIKSVFPTLPFDNIDFIVERLLPEYLEYDDSQREDFLSSSPIKHKVKYEDIQECLSIDEVLISLGFVRNEETYWELLDSPSGVCFRYYVDSDKLYEVDPKDELVLKGPITLGTLVDRIFS